MGAVRRRGPKAWLIDFYPPLGPRRRETIRAASRAEAERILKQREGDLARGRPLFARADTVKFEELTALVVRDYQLNKRKSTGKTEKNIERLTEFFGGWRAVNITATDVAAYVEKRLKTGLSNASTNRELATLKRAFHLAVQAKMLSHDHVPDIPMLKESAPRSGFFEPEQFRAVLRHLPPYIKPIAMVANELGWRLREILPLQWHQLNLAEGSLHLAPGITKNNEGRVVYLSPDLLEALRAQHALTRELERSSGVITPWVFHRKGGRQVHGVRKAWAKACHQAGVPGMVFHDLRRTAIRNMIRAGVPERVAMQVSGHKTRSVFERYNIVSEGDLQEAARRISVYHGANGNAQSTKPQGLAGRPDTKVEDGPAAR